jgi:hypothetical protein
VGILEAFREKNGMSRCIFKKILHLMYEPPATITCNEVLLVKLTLETFFKLVSIGSTAAIAVIFLYLLLIR